MEALEASSERKQPRYVVGASVGGGLGLLLACYVYYKYVQHVEEEKAKELRKKDYYITQELLVAAAHAEMQRYLQNEAELAAERKRQKAARRSERVEDAPRYGAGAYAAGPARDASSSRAPSTTSSATLVVSSLHSSELTYSEYSGGDSEQSDEESIQSSSHEDSAIEADGSINDSVYSSGSEYSELEIQSHSGVSSVVYSSSSSLQSGVEKNMFDETS